MKLEISGVLKNQLTPSPLPLPFFWKFYCPFRNGVGGY